MFQQHKHRTWVDVGFGLVVAVASTFMACTFGSPEGSCLPACDVNNDGIDSEQERIYYDLNKAPIRSLDEGERWTVYEYSGKIRVQHGYGCAHGNVEDDKSAVGIRIQDSAAVPRTFGDSGTIILNGWDVQYPNGDHHVQGLGSEIFNITEKRNADEYVLSWEAGGVLSDKDGNDGYKWCYRYTLVFWKQAASALDVVAYHDDDISLMFVEHMPSNSATALLDLKGTFTDPAPKSGGPQAVVPRGFGMSWENTDHHVLQAGFDLGTPPVGGTPVISGNEITWTSQTVWKDNSTVDDYYAAELVTVLSGQSVKMWQPRSVLHLVGTSWVEEPTELNLRPDEPADCDWLFGPEESLEFYSVENVPYDYAIPVLNGWDMSYVCTDHHVERIGVYLVEFDYVKAPNATHGTLNYTIFSTMRDDSDNGHAAKYKVSILGLNKLGGGAGK